MSNIKTIKQQLLVAVVFLLLSYTTIYAVNIDIKSMLSALQNNAGPVIRMTIAFSYVLGLWFIISAIRDLKMAGQSQSMMAQNTHAVSGPLMKLALGVALLYLPSTLNMALWTLWGHGVESTSLMAYNPSVGDPFGSTKQGVVMLVKAIGYVSFVRGFIILSRTTHQGSQPGTVGKGVLHIIGGILAINIVETIRVIGNSLGMSLI